MTTTDRFPRGLVLASLLRMQDDPRFSYAVIPDECWPEQVPVFPTICGTEIRQEMTALTFVCFLEDGHLAGCGWEKAWSGPIAW